MKSRIRSIPIIGLISAESLSLLGNQVAAVAIPILVLQYTNSPMVTGMASACHIIPIILAAFFGGRAIDRFGAWNMSMAADLLSFFSVLALPLAFIYTDEVSPWVIFLLVFLGALFDPTGISARQSLVLSVTKMSGQSLEKINSCRGGLENGADFLGPLVGIGLISAAGTINAFFINAITFVLCAVIFSVTVPRKREIAPMGHEDAALLGVTFIFKHAQLRALAIVGMIANFVILPFLGLLLPVLATQKFASVPLLGACLSVFGGAATIGAVLFPQLSQRCSRSVMYYGGLLVTGSSIIFCALATNQYQVIVCAALAGLLLGAGNPLEQTILQEETPGNIGGQVFTSYTAICFIAGQFGFLLAGMVAEFATIELVLLLAGGLLLTSAIFGWYNLPLVGANQRAMGEP
jgi:MFS family permease